MLFTALISLASLLHAQEADRKVITGTVVNSVTGEPIPRAAVVFNSNAPFEKTPVKDPKRVSLQATTDNSGRFSFPFSGDWWFMISASRQGFQNGTYSKDEEQDRKITIKLAPLSVIHGRVRNSEGEPVPGVHVQSFRTQILNGRRTVNETNRLTTDDLGEYRLFNFQPGDYYLRGGGKIQTYSTITNITTLTEAEDTFGSVFYPSSPTMDGGQVIHLLPGQTVQADFVLDPQPSFRIRGQIKGFTLYVRPTVRLLRGDDPLANRTAVQTVTGAFEVWDVTAGSYTVQAYSNERGFRFAEAPVTVVNRDVADVTLEMAAAVEIKGKLEFTGTPTGGTPSATQLLARNVRPAIEFVPRASRLPRPWNSTGNANPTPDGSFTVNLYPGTYDIQVAARGYYMGSATYGERDVLAAGLTVTTSGALELKIVAIGGGGEINGTVEGMETTDVRKLPGIVVALRQSGDWAYPLRGFVVQGKFSFMNLIPGEYTVYAWPSSREVEYYNPAVLQKLAASAVKVYIRDGAKETIVVKLAPAEESPH